MFRYGSRRLKNDVSLCGRRRSHGLSHSDVQSAKAYCADLLRKYDSPSYTLLAFIPPPARPAYLALRALNVEVARVPDTVSTPAVGTLRLQFWRDHVASALAEPPRPAAQPVAQLLAWAQADLRARAAAGAPAADRAGGAVGISAHWLQRAIAAREPDLDERPVPSLDELEARAERAYSGLLYATLQALPLQSLAADHVASHVGKAMGLAAALRGLPLRAFPDQAAERHHANSALLPDAVAQQRARTRQGVVALPLDVMADVGLREEDVLRRGPAAEGLRNAVFAVATRASDHLLTAGAMLTNLRRGQDVGHEFEHAEGGAEAGAHPAKPGSVEQQLADVNSAFGVFMPAVSTRLWLERLQKADFDIFRDDLRQRDWRLPWKAFVAYRRKQIT